MCSLSQAGFAPPQPQQPRIPCCASPSSTTAFCPRPIHCAPWCAFALFQFVQVMCDGFDNVCATRDCLFALIRFASGCCKVRTMVLVFSGRHSMGDEPLRPPSQPGFGSPILIASNGQSGRVRCRKLSHFRPLRIKGLRGVFDRSATGILAGSEPRQIASQSLGIID